MRSGHEGCAARETRECRRSLLALENCHEDEIDETNFGSTALRFALAVHCAGGVLRCGKPIRPTGAGFGQQTVAERVAATGGADCVVSGCACCSDSCGFDVSNANR